MKKWVEISSFHQPTNQRKRTSYRKHHSFLIGSPPFLFKVPWCPSCHVLSKMLRIHLRHVFLKRWPIWLDQCPCSCDFKNAWNHRLIDWNSFNWTPYFSRNRFHCIDWEVPDGNCCFGVYLHCAHSERLKLLRQSPRSSHLGTWSWETKIRLNKLKTSIYTIGICRL